MAVRTPRAPVPGAGLTRALLNWFATEQRALPWRGSRDPYRIWVAEVLLQQTRVAQAIPYYQRFLQRFPTVKALARAREATVLRVWQGAGYYARARHLHAAARRIVRDHGGRLPSSLRQLEDLPGFGPYIARAVASLAFGISVVALEANGQRVAARWWADRGDVRTGRVRRRQESRLRSLLDDQPPRAFNEAVMELGETICLPRTPRCGACPVRRHCRAFALLRDPGSIPPQRRRSLRPHVRAAIVVLEHQNRLLVQRRPADGLLGGLYEFPGGKIEPGETPLEAARRELREEVGLRRRNLTFRGVVHHAYSHFTVELHVFSARLGHRPTRALGDEQRWADRSEMARLPLPKATEKALDLLRMATG